MAASSNSSLPGLASIGSSDSSTAAPQADQPLVDQCPGGESNCRSQLEVAGPRWTKRVEGVSWACWEIGWDLGHTKYIKVESGKVCSGRSVISLLILWIALPSSDLFPTMFQLVAACPDWVLRCSNILCEPAEIREWNIKPRSPELVAFHPSN